MQDSHANHYAMAVCISARTNKLYEMVTNNSDRNIVCKITHYPDRIQLLHVCTLLPRLVLFSVKFTSRYKRTPKFVKVK